jgi:hypothetical protein
MAAIGVPILAVAVYMYFSFAGLAAMKPENEAVRATLETPFTLSEVLYRSAQLIPADFRVVFPAFTGAAPVLLGSLLLVVVLYVGGVRVARSSHERQRLHVLFVLAVSATIFLAVVSLAAGHYKFLYYRYHSFGVPFACLFTAYALATLLKTPKATKPLKVAAVCLIVIPCVALYATLFRTYRPPQRFSHVGVAREIATNGIAKVAVPEWRDALLLHALLPNGYVMRYVRNEGSPFFTLYEPDGQTRVRARIRR